MGNKLGEFGENRRSFTKEVRFDPIDLGGLNREVNAK